MYSYLSFTGQFGRFLGIDLASRAECRDVLFIFLGGEMFYCSQPGTKYLHKVNIMTGRHESCRQSWGIPGSRRLCIRCNFSWACRYVFDLTPFSWGNFKVMQWLCHADVSVGESFAWTETYSRRKGHVYFKWSILLASS